MMTPRQTTDYVAIFEKIKELIKYPAVSEIVSDFERAMWSAVKTCFPAVVHKGCSFHWKQAIKKQVNLCKNIIDKPLLKYQDNNIFYLRRFNQ